MNEDQLMMVAFTGHRDHKVQEQFLDFVASLGTKNAHWMQGDVKDGFDRQVKLYAKKHNIPCDDYPLDLKTYGSPQAYFVRNRLMVDLCDFLVACYDGRKYGGTFYTVEYARHMNKPVLFLPCVQGKLVKSG